MGREGWGGVWRCAEGASGQWVWGGLGRVGRVVGGVWGLTAVGVSGPRPVARREEKARRSKLGAARPRAGRVLLQPLQNPGPGVRRGHGAIRCFG